MSRLDAHHVPPSVGAKSMPLPEVETLRDRFAMAAIQGFCSQCDATGMWSWQSKDAAAFAYEIADAMMEARK